MALFDAFTGEAQREGQQAARSFLDDIRFETGQDLTAGLNQGLGYIQQGINPQLNAYAAAANQAQNAITGGNLYGSSSVREMLNPSVNDLWWGYGAAQGAAQQGREGAQAAWAPVQALAGQYGDERALAAAMSQSALGLTDPSAARNAFRTSPAYEFMLNEGLNSIARNANRSGMVASGNQMRESQTYGSGLADKEWDDWLNRLFGREQLYAPLAMQGRVAAGQGLSQADIAMAQMLGQAGIATGGKLADTYGQAGRTLADLQMRSGQAGADIASQYGKNIANVFGTLGSQAQADFLKDLLNIKTQANVGLAGGEAKTFVGEGDAATQASKNFFDTLIGAANAAAKAFGGK